MIPGLTSIIIPAYNHAALVARAIESAKAQTAAVEVVVVDDGSVDDTLRAAGAFVDVAESVRVFGRAHKGVAAARNYGIEQARGEFVMFLDADDTIEPDKIAAQLAAFEPRVGFVLSDVRIVETNGREERASERYAYAARDLSGWVAPQLIGGNFIPIMSPLIRREALGDIRFQDRALEDWHFWYDVACVARCAYVPRVLATYHKQAGGRNTGTKATRLDAPGVALPLRLNLGCGNPLARSWHPVPGLVNLDKSLGWKFEDGLHEFADGSVDGISISHALMYVARDRWPFVFGEFSRVLKRGGVIRITEDDTSAIGSRTYVRGWHDAVTLTYPAMMRRELESVGFTVHDVTAEATHYGDRSLCQSQHGDAPHVFYIEGIRERALLLSPHADDETLFAAFTMIRHRPHVVICFPSSGDYGNTDERLQESRDAATILGAGPVEQWDGDYLVAQMHELDARIRPTRVFAPSPYASHADHVLVALAAAKVFGDRLTQYHTYNMPNGGKVRTGEPVAFEQAWVARKRAALACYRTQWNHPRARMFFDDDLAEYMP